MKMQTLGWAMLFGMTVSPLWSAMASVDIQGTSAGSSIRGSAQLQDTPKGLQVTVQISSVPAGSHAFHIHEFGACGDSGKAAGGHYNPQHRPHGHAIQDGPQHAHPGDMGNVVADDNGQVSVSVLLPGVTLSGEALPVAGRALILHEKADDFSQPTGNAGGRIACGSILLSGN